MMTYSVAASELKYGRKGSSSWSTGKARQGVYSNTRYGGAITFAGLADFDMSNISIKQIEMYVTLLKAGREGEKYLTFYEAAKDTVSGTLASMCGAAMGKIAIADAYNRSVTLKFNESTNAGLFTAFRDYFMAGNRILMTYVPETRGTYTAGCCYDYLGIGAMTLTITYDHKQSTGALDKTVVAAGSTLTMNIMSSSPDHSHRLTCTLGEHSASQTVTAGATSATTVFPLSWLDAIPDKTSGPASVTLETLDAGGNSLGASTHAVTVTVPDSIVPDLQGVLITPVNEYYEVLAEWNLFAYGISSAEITVLGAAGKYGASIQSYSITTDPFVGSGSAAQFTTGPLMRFGPIKVTATVTDTRGRSASVSSTFQVQAYAPPIITSVQAYRCTSDGTQDDVNGTYAYIKANYGYSSLAGNNGATAEVTISQAGGEYSDYGYLDNGEGVILGDGMLQPDAAYEVFILVHDELREYTAYNGYIGSAEYVLHIKKGGKAIGFGMAAGEDETASFGWPVKMKVPLAISEGGTGGREAWEALLNLGAVALSGDTMTGNLNISTSLYPSLVLLPSNNGCTYRTVVEGSYVGASSLSTWEDGTGNNRRMLEIRNAAYAPSPDNALMLRCVINGSYYQYRVFHAGMAAPVPVSCGGTGANNGKAALEKLGVFFSETLPESGEDGQICLVPV